MQLEDVSCKNYRFIIVLYGTIGSRKHSDPLMTLKHDGNS